MSTSEITHATKPTKQELGIRIAKNSLKQLPVALLLLLVGHFVYSGAQDDTSRQLIGNVLTFIGGIGLLVVIVGLMIAGVIILMNKDFDADKPVI